MAAYPTSAVDTRRRDPAAPPVRILLAALTAAALLQVCGAPVEARTVLTCSGAGTYQLIWNRYDYYEINHVCDAGPTDYRITLDDDGSIHIRYADNVTARIDFQDTTYYHPDKHYYFGVTCEAVDPEDMDELWGQHADGRFATHEFLDGAVTGTYTDTRITGEGRTYFRGGTDNHIIDTWVFAFDLPCEKTAEPPVLPVCAAPLIASQTRGGAVPTATPTPESRPSCSISPSTLNLNVDETDAVEFDVAYDGCGKIVKVLVVEVLTDWGLFGLRARPLTDHIYGVNQPNGTKRVRIAWCGRVSRWQLPVIGYPRVPFAFTAWVEDGAGVRSERALVDGAWVCPRPTHHAWFTTCQKRVLTALGTTLGLGASHFAYVAATAAPVPGGQAPSAAAGGTAAGLGAASFVVFQLASDPPDPDFRAIAEPIVPLLSALPAQPGLSGAQAEAVNAFMEDVARVIAVERALLVSVERFQGAVLAGDDAWRATHHAKVVGHSATLAMLLLRWPTASAEVQRVFRGSAFLDVTLSAADIRAAQANIAANGLPPPLRDVARELGADDETMRALEATVLGHDPDALAGQNVLEVLTDPALASGLRRLVLHLDPSLNPALLNPAKCYTAKGRRRRQEVVLADAFETKATTVLGPAMACNPSDLLGLGVSDAATRLTCHKIKDAKAKPRQPRFTARDVVVQTRFGEQALAVLKPKLLCLPTTSETDMALLGRRIDGMKCYQATGPSTVRQALVTDEFESKETAILEPRMFCSPIGAGEEVSDPDTSLVCYRIKDVKTKPKQSRFRKRKVTLWSGLGEQPVGFKKPQMLCVPTLQPLDLPAPTPVSTTSTTLTVTTGTTPTTTTTTTTTTTPASTTTLPAGGCAATGAPGCGGCPCEACVCAEDAFCCTMAWDEFCVALCRDRCGGLCGSPSGAFLGATEVGRD